MNDASPKQRMHRLWLALALMLCGMVACVLLRPHGLATNDGISYYGTFRSTLLPYAVALLGPAYLLVIQARQTYAYPSWIRRAFEGFGVLIVGIVCTPYTLGTIFNIIHTTLGSILFAGQLVVTAVLALQSKWRALYAVWLLELLAGIMCAIYVLPANGYLFEWQLVFQIVFFGFLLMYETGLRRQLSISSQIPQRERTLQT